MVLFFLFLFANWEERSYAQEGFIFSPLFPCLCVRFFALCFETLIVTNQCIIVPEGPIFGDMQDVGPLCLWAMAHQLYSLIGYASIWIVKEEGYVVLQSKNPVACTMFYHVNVNPHSHHHHHHFRTQTFITLIYFYNIMNQ